MLVLSACAPATRLEIGHSGSAPRPATIALDAPATPPEFEAAINEGLARSGFSLSDHPVYRLQVSLSQAQGKVGLFEPQAQGDAAGVWTMRPGQSRSTMTFRATMSLTEAATGREIFRAHANERARKEQPGLSKRLAEGLIAQFSAAPAPARP